VAVERRGSILEYLGLPEQECVVFDRPPLALALCQVQFEGLLDLTTEGVAPFQRALRREFPRLSRVQQFSLEIEAGPREEPDGVQQKQQPPVWRMSDVAGNWTVALARTFVTLEVREYGRFEGFLRRLRTVLDALVEHVQPTIGTRVGLRYVNEIRLGEARADEVVRREVLGPLAERSLDEHAHQTLQQVLLRYPEHQGINFTHGRLPGGSTVQRKSDEAAPEGPFYLLDIDVFRQYPAPSVLELESELICQQVETFHEALYRVFRWAVSPAYVESMGVGQ